MKVLGVFLLTISFAAITFAEPVCEASDLDTLWADDVEKDVYYQCLDVRRSAKLRCQGDKWFYFIAQSCVPKSQWYPLPSTSTKHPTPQTDAPIAASTAAPTAAPSAATPAPTVPTAPTAGPTNPPYPTIEQSHPTPPTKPPTAAPAPDPTDAPSPESTIPTAPSIDDKKPLRKRPARKS